MYDLVLSFFIESVASRTSDDMREIDLDSHLPLTFFSFAQCGQHTKREPGSFFAAVVFVRFSFRQEYDSLQRIHMSYWRRKSYFHLLNNQICRSAIFTLLYICTFGFKVHPKKGKIDCCPIMKELPTCSWVSKAVKNISGGSYICATFLLCKMKRNGQALFLCEKLMPLRTLIL